LADEPDSADQTSKSIAACRYLAAVPVGLIAEHFGYR
jgi:hypothetical protein